MVARGEVSMERALAAHVQFQLLTDISAVRERCSRPGVKFTEYLFWHSGISIVSEPQSSVFEAVNH